METPFASKYFAGPFKFKSYYVVWKLKPAATPTKYGFLFKSYYVVWKPRAWDISSTFVRVFKSYYVVWKLVGADTYFRHVMSLNRTM